jgi:hypothetical protein
MGYIMFFVLLVVIFYVWMISYALKNAKKAYPGAISSTPTSAPSLKSQKTVIYGDWEGGRPLLPRQHFALFGGMGGSDSDTLHDVTDGYDGATFDYDA